MWCGIGDCDSPLHTLFSRDKKKIKRKRIMTTSEADYKPNQIRVS